MRCLVADLVAAGRITEAEGHACLEHRKSKPRAVPSLSIVSDAALKRAAAAAVQHDYSGLGRQLAELVQGDE